jgi:hypothetical protein
MADSGYLKVTGGNCFSFHIAIVEKPALVTMTVALWMQKRPNKSGGIVVLVRDNSGVHGWRDPESGGAMTLEEFIDRVEDLAAFLTAEFGRSQALDRMVYPEGGQLPLDPHQAVLYMGLADSEMLHTGDEVEALLLERCPLPVVDVSPHTMLYRAAGPEVVVQLKRGVSMEFPPPTREVDFEKVGGLLAADLGQFSFYLEDDQQQLAVYRRAGVPS